MSNSLPPLGPQHARTPCPSPIPGIYSYLFLLNPTESHLILCHPLLLLSIFPNIRVFSNELTLHIRWPKYWSFRFNISPSSEHSGLISFRMDWLGLLAVQGTLKESSPTPPFKSINSSVLIFIVQLSHPSMTTRKTIALTRRTFVGKVPEKCKLK